MTRQDFQIDSNSRMSSSSPARLERSINSLLGIIEGIALDREINAVELQFLNRWLADHADVSQRHPYNELILPINAALEDGRLTEEERRDIAWLCEKLRSTQFSGAIAADLLRLRAIAGGIASDGQVNEAEVRELSEWLQEHEHLKSCWPYDEIDSLVATVLQDGRIDESEHKILRSYFSAFIDINGGQSIARSPAPDHSVMGVCALCPEIRFEGSVFCLAGASARLSHGEFSELISELGGNCVRDIHSGVNYLVIGAEGNPCWEYACYGRTVEAAIELRKVGTRVVIVHENDFHDAIADLR